MVYIGRDDTDNRHNIHINIRDSQRDMRKRYMFTQLHIRETSEDDRQRHT